MKNNRRISLKEILIRHIQNNLKAYIIVSILFLIGVIVGVLFTNRISEESSQEVSGYLTSFITSLKNNSQIDRAALFRNSIMNNAKLALILWFVGSTVIGIPVVYGIVAFRGFCLGYTIAVAVAVLGGMKGLAFCMSTILFQNIIFIPGILALAVSGIQLYKSIVKDKRKENIKMEIYRHTLFSAFIMIFLCISSFLEVYVSTNILAMIIKYL